MKRKGKHHTFFLKDLLMMQMIADFESFLGAIKDNDKDKVTSMIEEAYNSSTTLKLFPGIINKTIEAQFGDKYACLRELGQNAIDSYGKNQLGIERLINFEYEQKKTYGTLSVMDFGCGMSLNSLIKDLLIPYNSAKELDETKIGEHGIGWYSIVDIAEYVHVITKTASEVNSSEAVVYIDSDYNWKATISYGPTDEVETSGTKVIAHILKEKEVSSKKIRSNLYKYLGMVKSNQGYIKYKNCVINTLQQEYESTSIIDMIIDGNKVPLKMGVNKKRILEGDSEEKYSYRSANINQVLVTQRGLFVNYDNVPYNTDSIHYKLATDLTNIGLDFWIDLPDCVTLTKGRNSIISNHQLPVLDASYSAFEDTFLDSILADNSLMEKTSDNIYKSVSEIFRDTYGKRVQKKERTKYGIKRKIRYASSKTLSFISDRIIGWLSNLPLSLYMYLGALFGAALVVAFFGPYLFGIIIKIPYIEQIAVLLVQCSIGGLLGILTLRLLKSIAGTLLNIIRGIHETLAKKKVIKHRELNGPKIVFSFRGVMDILRVISFSIKTLAKGTLYLLVQFFILLYNAPKNALWLFLYLCRLSKALPEVIGGLKSKVVKTLGLYENLEDKRDKKREIKRKKITRKYLSSVHKNQFFKRILNKPTIPVIFYSVKTKEEPPPEKAESFLSIFRESFNEVFSFNNGSNNAYWGKNTAWNGGTSYRGPVNKSFLNPQKIYERHEKISIDTLIDLYLRDKLVYEKYATYRANRVYVDNSNPLVFEVLSKMQRISSEVRNKYDVKLIEDRIDSARLIVYSSISLTIAILFALTILSIPFSFLIILQNIFLNYTGSIGFYLIDSVFLKFIKYLIIFQGIIITAIIVSFIKSKDNSIIKDVRKIFGFLISAFFKKRKKEKEEQGIDAGVFVKEDVNFFYKEAVQVLKVITVDFIKLFYSLTKAALFQYLPKALKSLCVLMISVFIGSAKLLIRLPLAIIAIVLRTLKKLLGTPRFAKKILIFLVGMPIKIWSNLKGTFKMRVKNIEFVQEKELQEITSLLNNAGKSYLDHYRCCNKIFGIILDYFKCKDRPEFYLKLSGDSFILFSKDHIASSNKFGYAYTIEGVSYTIMQATPYSYMNFFKEKGVKSRYPHLLAKLFLNELAEDNKINVQIKDEKPRSTDKLKIFIDFYQYLIKNSISLTDEIQPFLNDYGYYKYRVSSEELLGFINSPKKELKDINLKIKEEYLREKKEKEEREKKEKDLQAKKALEGEDVANEYLLNSKR